jgi:hypothetical protein
MQTFMKNDNSSKTQATIATFKAVLEATAGEPIIERGRRIEAFSHKDDKGNRIVRQPAAYAAYAKRLRDFKYLLAIVKGLPLDDLSTITNRLSGSFRLPLHLFLHHCLPSYPEKSAMLDKHRSVNAADKVMNNILGEIEAWLDQRQISDQTYAARLLDDPLLIEYAEHWLQTARLHSLMGRGLNENTNGLIRQYFPKQTDFGKITGEQVRQIQDKLNDRPRKCLGWRTPREVFSDQAAIVALPG